MIFMGLSEEEPLTAQHKFLTLTLACLDRLTVLLQLWLPWQHRQPIRMWCIDQQSLQAFGFIAAVPDVDLGQNTSSGPAWSPVSREVCTWSHALLRSNPVLYTEGL